LLVCFVASAVVLIPYSLPFGAQRRNMQQHSRLMHGTFVNII
jgi:hypothetical protein